MLVPSSIYRFLPQFEIGGLRRANVFPIGPVDLLQFPTGAEICLASKSRTLGDNLVLTTLPRKIRALRPDIRISIYPRGFAPWVFLNNPHVAGINLNPRTLWGDDCNWGEGHLIHLKESFFGLSHSMPPRPEIYLSETEKSAALGVFKAEGVNSKEVCIFHPWGRTQTSVASKEIWAQVVRALQEEFLVWQIGGESEVRIEGIHRFHPLDVKNRSACRSLFALIEQAGAFVGVDSGPMHIARAFGLSSLVFLQQSVLDGLFKARSLPYFLADNRKSAFLYEENQHLCPATITDLILKEAMRNLSTVKKTQG